MELLRVVSVGDLIVTLERFRAEVPGATLDQHACVIWRFAGEYCAEIWSHFEDQPGCDEFWRKVAALQAAAADGQQRV